MRRLLGLGLLPAVSMAVALNAPVEDLGEGDLPVRSVPVSSNAPRVAAPAPQNQALVDLHFELQSLRDEVRELRGIVEEQSNELRKLQQRQLDDYQDLDRRLSATTAPVSQVPAAPAGATSQSMPLPVTPVASAQTAPATVETSPAASGGGDDYEAYTATYNLLKARKIDEAVAGFTVFVAKFPNSPYTANAYYWLGEIYLLQNNLDEAAKAFSTVTGRFPAHRKALDAKFKLAKVYHLQGKTAQARALLNEVAATNSSAAALAKAYLNDNF